MMFHSFDYLYLDEAEVFGGQETGEQIPRDDWKTKKTEGLVFSDHIPILSRYI